MKKKGLSILLSVCLLLTLLSTTVLAAAATQIKVAGVELYGTGYYHISPGSVGNRLDSEPADTTGYVHWDKTVSTITLYGVTIDGGNENSGIYASGDFTIILAESTDNTVTSNFSNAITCDRGSVTIKGAGTLHATGATNGIKANYSVNISDNANVTVTGNNGCGIVNNPTVFSNNQDPVRIDATATASIIGSTYGICVEDGYGASPVIDSINVTIAGKTSAFSAFPHGAPKLGKAVAALAGDSSESNLKAFDSAAYSTYKYVKTIQPNYTVSFDINGGFSGTMSPIAIASNEYTLPENGFRGWSNQYFKAWDVNGVEKQPGDKITVTEDITVKAIWQDKDYGITVGGVKVTYENASNVTGTNITGGTVSYDLATKTLTLNNATIAAGKHLGGTITSAIQSNSSLTIHLVGNNTVNGAPAAGESGSSHQYAISSYEDITFTGDGSLNVTAADGGSFSVAISADNLTVESGCTITAVSGTSDFLMRALDYDGVFTANGSTVLASTSATGSSLVAFDKDDNSSYKYVKIQPAYNVTVSFDANGGTGTMASDTVVCADEYTLPENGFTPPDGKQFKAWNVNGAEKAPGDKVMLVENTTITAVWESPAHVCDIKPVDKLDPDCTEGGKEAYYKCEGCGKFFEDANGTVEIADIAAWGNLNKLDHIDANEDGKCDTCDKDLDKTPAPDDTDNSEDHTDSKDNNESSNETQSPQTGDYSNPVLWLMLFIVSGFGIVTVCLFDKRFFSAK